MNRVIIGDRDMEGKKRPTVRDIVALPFFGIKPYVSPDCSKVIYLKAVQNLKQNSFAVEGYIYEIETKETYKLFTTGRNIKWFDSDSICCLQPVHPSGNAQIHVYRGLIGEPTQITEHPTAIESFELFGNGYVFTSSRPNSQSKNRIGNFNHVENEEPNSGLFFVNGERALKNLELSANHFKEENIENIPSTFEITHLLDEPLAIDSFVVSPEKNTIYLNCQPRSGLIFEDDTICFRIELDPDSILEKIESLTLVDALTSIKLVKLDLPKGYKVLKVSPDGNKILLTGRDTESVIESRPDLWIVDDSDLEKTGIENKLKCITEKLDRQYEDVCWTEKGLFVLHLEESRYNLVKIDEYGEFETIPLGEAFPTGFFSINKNGYLAFLGSSPTKLKEIYFGTPRENTWDITRVTTETEKFSHLDFGTVESIRWTSKDGTEIEGLLRKPSDFDPNKKYPLIIMPHGGPRGSSTISLLQNDYYRAEHSLLAKGILILQPNYRGGLGRGKAFMELNHNNMGVGDMWDIESGIDYLISLGYIDEAKVGCMGGSQGGYLSAFGGMHTDRFVAVNVMAGVSSWYIYYIGSDNRNNIHLTGTPYEPESRDYYRKSAPIAAIDRAKTPMLIQHGEDDERISVISAQELYRALKHKGVPVELFTYPGKGHGFIAPQDNYAMMLQVYRWFCHYLLGEELDFFKDDF